MSISTDIKKSVVVLQGSPRKKGNSTILAIVLLESKTE